MFGDKISRSGDPTRMEQKMIPIALFILPKWTNFSFLPKQVRAKSYGEGAVYGDD